MTSARWRLVVSFGLVMLLAACGGGGRVRVVISPATAHLAPGASARFEATVTGTSDTGVTWQAERGTVSGSGAAVEYTAPSTAGTDTVTVRSVADPRQSARATVTVEASAPSGSGISLMVSPSAVTFTELGASRRLRVRAFDGAGNEVSTADLELEWLLSDGSQVALTTDPGDPAQVTLSASTSVGSAVVSVRSRVEPEVASPPVSVVIAEVKEGVHLLDDDVVVFPPVDVPPNADPSTFLPPGFTRQNGVTYAGGFRGAEVEALLEAVGEDRVRLPVVLEGKAPAVGTALLASGGAPILGTVVRAEQRGAYALVQVEQTGLETVFSAFRYDFDAQALTQEGVLSAASSAGGDGAPLRPQALSCTTSGGLSLDDLPDLDVTATPGLIGDLVVDLEGGAFRFLVGVELDVDLAAQLRAGIGGSITCPIGKVFKKVLPVGGAVAAIAAPYVSMQPKLIVALTASGELGATAVLRGTAVAQVGVDCHDDACTNLSKVAFSDPEASFTYDGLASTDWVLTPGVYLTGQAGAQLGGTSLTEACDGFAWFLGLIGIGDACNKVEAGLAIDVLHGKAGGQLKATWSMPGSVLAAQASRSQVAVQLHGDMALKNTQLNNLLQKFAVAPQSFTLVSGDLVLGTFYRSMAYGAMEVDGRTVNAGDSVPAGLGDSVQVVVSGDFGADSLLFDTGDTELGRAEVWLRSGSGDAFSPLPGVAPVVDAGTDSFSVTVPVTAELCAANDEVLPVHFLGYNQLAGIDTAGYLGNVVLICGPKIPDPNLRGAIQTALGLSRSPTYSELEQLTELTADGVQDLDGLQSATKLATLNLGSGGVTDLAPLAELTSLSTLRVTSNPVVDLSALAGLSGLSVLRLSAGQVVGLGPLADLVALHDLDLAGNEISDLTPLAGLTSLDSLSLGGNQISDVGPLASLSSVKSLGLAVNQISDLGPLSGLNLLAYLDLQRNRIADIQPLVDNAGLADLDVVDLSGNCLDLGPDTGDGQDVDALVARGVIVATGGQGGTQCPAAP